MHHEKIIIHLANVGIKHLTLPYVKKSVATTQATGVPIAMPLS